MKLKNLIMMSSFLFVTNLYSATCIVQENKIYVSSSGVDYTCEERQGLITQLSCESELSNFKLSFIPRFDEEAQKLHLHNGVVYGEASLKKALLIFSVSGDLECRD